MNNYNWNVPVLNWQNAASGLIKTRPGASSGTVSSIGKLLMISAK